MHGLSRLGNGLNSPPSVSPPSSPRYRHSSRSKSTEIGGAGGGGGGGFLRHDGGHVGGLGEMKWHNLVERLGFAVISAVYRRRGVLLLAPLLYISLMLLYMSSVGFDTVANLSNRSGDNGDDLARPGSVYRSPQLFEKLWPFMEAESINGSSNLVRFLMF